MFCTASVHIAENPLKISKKDMAQNEKRMNFKNLKIVNPFFNMKSQENFAKLIKKFQKLT